MFLDPLIKMLPLLALGILGVATLLVALGALRSARRAEHLGEGRFELLRDLHRSIIGWGNESGMNSEQTSENSGQEKFT